jgi:hypothetical protein
MFSFKVSVLRLTDIQIASSSSSSIAATFSQAACVQPIKKPLSSFRESFICSGKQGGRVTGLGGGM